MKVIAKLIVAGVSPELVAEVAQAIAEAAKPDPVAEKRRAYDRERKRRGVCTPELPPENLPDKERSPTPPKEINPPLPLTSFAGANGHAVGDLPAGSEIDLFGKPEPSTKVSRRKPVDDDWMPEVGAQWNELAARYRLPQVNDIHKTRQSLLRARLKDLRSLEPLTDVEPPAAFRWFFGKIRGSPFLRGDVPGKSSPATFDWVLNLLNFHKIVDGNYEGSRQTGNVVGFRR